MNDYITNVIRPAQQNTLSQLNENDKALLALKQELAGEIIKNEALLARLRSI